MPLPAPDNPPVLCMAVFDPYSYDPEDCVAVVGPAKSLVLDMTNNEILSMPPSLGEIDDSCAAAAGHLDGVPFVIVAGDSAVQLYKDGGWTILSKMQKSHSMASGVMFDNLFFVTGGGSECESYNFGKSSWNCVASLGVPCFKHATVVYNGAIVVIGGQDEKGRPVETCESYNVKMDRWEFFPRLVFCKTPVHTAAVVQDKIYAVGDDHLEVYDGFNWIPFMMDFRREGHTAVCVNNMLCLLGGDRPEIDMYDPMTKTWSLSSLALNPRWSVDTIIVA